MTKLTVHSNVCDYIHKIHSEQKGKNVLINIDTSCKKVKNLSGIEVPKMEIFNIKDNFVMQKSQESGCCATCIVPSGIIHACWIESGFMAESMAKDARNICIEFDEE
ncbi:hypothetical protein [Methanohalobium sp.]|uniref:DUF6951 family protein n=1 Tax=Methanohalobium sp. TaxID=2837493 RepID=UPI0025DE5BD2|nr:hypothetical protein [Methanohalobium sp.]